MPSMNDNPFRQLPAVHQLLDHPLLQSARSGHPHAVLLEAARAELDRVRNEMKTKTVPVEIDFIARRIVERVSQSSKPRLRQVTNATGIVLHTNLGRSPMAEEAARAAYDAARGYLNLELDLVTGKRSSRQDPIREWLTRLTGAESATVVNNCAAATVITLSTLAAGKEVIVSRGQLIEIGGSFRIPEIMGVSAAMLREVGTTNITRIGDYEKAIGPNTGMLLRIHPSNYRIRGFTEEAPLKELVDLGKKYSLPVIDDAGSGAMIDLQPLGLVGEPVVSQSLAAGADLVLCSGDKLLGGPQAGLIIGKKMLVDRIEKNPLMRALRLDKMTLAALEATLRIYLDANHATERIPTLRLLTMKPDELRRRADSFAARLYEIPGITLEVREDSGFAGGGSLPDQPLPSVVVALKAETIGETTIAECLRTGEPAVLARVQDGRVLFDLRTVFAWQEEGLIEAVRRAIVAG